MNGPVPDRSFSIDALVGITNYGNQYIDRWLDEGMTDRQYTALQSALCRRRLDAGETQRLAKMLELRLSYFKPINEEALSGIFYVSKLLALTVAGKFSSKLNDKIPLINGNVTPETDCLQSRLFTVVTSLVDANFSNTAIKIIQLFAQFRCNETWQNIRDKIEAIEF